MLVKNWMVVEKRIHHKEETVKRKTNASFLVQFWFAGSTFLSLPEYQVGVRRSVSMTQQVLWMRAAVLLLRGSGNLGTRCKWSRTVDRSENTSGKLKSNLFKRNSKSHEF